MIDREWPRWPDYTNEEARAVAEVLLSSRVNYWTGSECRAFEEEYARWTGARKAVAVANGTLALEGALRALDIGHGDEVIVTPRSFIASVSVVVMAGATPVFADVDSDSQNITANSIEQVVTKRTRAILLVHLGGWPCDMTGILDLARTHHLSVIEDCAQAHGAKYKGKSVGTFGQIGTWSFCQDKIITTGGEGGMVTTDVEELWARVWSLKDHGKSVKTLQSGQPSSSFKWVHESFGSNWRLTEMQAAIGRIQLRRISEWHRTRTSHAERLGRICAECPGLRVPMPHEDCEHAWYKFHAFVIPDALRAGWSRDRIANEIRSYGVPCFSGSCPEVYLEQAFAHTKWRPRTRLPVARALGETSLMLQVHPTLSDDDITRVGDAIKRTMRRATR